MRVSNRMEFTENHRYCAVREFGLSGLDRRLLAALYQPMAGAAAVSFYNLLYHELPDDGVGCSTPDSQRKLMLGLGLELGIAGRLALIDASSRLEAVGLLQVYRRYNPLTEENLFEYYLLKPLSAAEFFSNVHLTLLLRDKLGRNAVLELRSALGAESPAELGRFTGREEVTTPFYELFRLDPQVTDPELERGWEESAPALEAARPAKPPDKIRHSEMMMRFPRGSANRKHVERMNRSPGLMEQVNYLAYKFDLGTPEVCRLLDEDGVFHDDGTLAWDELHHRANLVYRQDRKREEERARMLTRGGERIAEAAGDEDGDAAPGAAADGGVAPQLAIPERFQEKVSVKRYNEMLRREPYTRMLARYFPGAVPGPFVQLFEKFDMHYRLPEPVINVLIHYIFSLDEAQRLTKSFIDSIASNMLAKGIDTPDKAVRYIIAQQKLNETLERKRRGEEEPGGTAAGRGGGTGRGRAAARRKPDMPVARDDGSTRPASPEELERMLELARELKSDG